MTTDMDEYGCLRSLVDKCKIDGNVNIAKTSSVLLCLFSQEGFFRRKLEPSVMGTGAASSRL